MDLPVGITTLHLSRKSVYLLLLAVALAGFGGYSYVPADNSGGEPPGPPDTGPAGGRDRR